MRRGCTRRGGRADLVGLPVAGCAGQPRCPRPAALPHPPRRAAGRGLVLLAVFRRPRRPSCRWSRSRSPQAGRRWSSSSSRIPLNPMSVTLGALVIAISTEFSVLSERYRQEREAGHAPRGALRRTYRSTGAPYSPRGSPRSPASGSWRLRHQDAARLRAGDRRRPHGGPDRRDDRPARCARARRAAASCESDATREGRPRPCPAASTAGARGMTPGGRAGAGSRPGEPLRVVSLASSGCCSSPT